MPYACAARESPAACCFPVNADGGRIRAGREKLGNSKTIDSHLFPVGEEHEDDGVDIVGDCP